MNLNIEIAPQDLQVLAAHAARLGVPIERVAADTFADAIRRDLQSQTQSNTQSPAPSGHSDGAQSENAPSDEIATDGRDFMARLDASAATIADGTLRPITSDDISDAIAAARPQPDQRAAL